MIFTAERVEFILVFMLLFFFVCLFKSIYPSSTPSFSSPEGHKVCWSLSLLSVGKITLDKTSKISRYKQTGHSVKTTVQPFEKESKNPGHQAFMLVSENTANAGDMGVASQGSEPVQSGTCMISTMQ